MTDSSPAQSFPIGYKSSKEINNMDFNLFELAKLNNVRSPAYFKGSNCKELFHNLVDDVCTIKKCSRWMLSKELSAFYNSDLTTIQKFVYSKNHFPVYLVSKMIERLAEPDKKKYLDKFNVAVEFFKVSNSHDWIVFPRNVSAELAWLCGAVAADGWISKETNETEKMGIIDFHQKALIKASLFFDKCFGYKPIVSRCRTKNCWQIRFRSKSITKFFTTYLGFHYGVKVYDIREPVVVKQSKFRLDYASGVLTFDGSVEMDGVVSLACASENLVKDVCEILQNTGLKVSFKKRIMPKQTLYFVKSECLLRHKNADKWISIFGTDVEKGQRLQSLVHGFDNKVNSEEEVLIRLKRFINYTRKNECPLDNLFFTLKKEGIIKRQKLLKLTKLSHVTFHKYVWLLRQAKIVTYAVGYFGRGIENEYRFNYDINTWRGPMVS